MNIQNVEINGLKNVLRVAGFPMAETVEKANGYALQDEIDYWLNNDLHEVYLILENNKDKYKLIGDVVEVTLKDRVIKISPQDLVEFNKFKWTYNPARGYVRDSKGTMELHRFIAGFPENQVVDHINGDKDDYTRRNLRVCSHRETKITHLPKAPSIVNVMKRHKTIVVLSSCEGASGHEQFLTGITVTFDVTGTIQWWQEAERYRFLYFISSQSKMHRAHKMGIKACCNEYVDDKIIEIVEMHQARYLEALEKSAAGEMGKDEVMKYFYKMIYNIPSGFEYTAGMTTNYRQLKTIYNQRRTHRLKEWQDFCDWIEQLPESYLITGNYNKNK